MFYSWSLGCALWSNSSSIYINLILNKKGVLAIMKTKINVLDSLCYHLVCMCINNLKSYSSKDKKS